MHPPTHQPPHPQPDPAAAPGQPGAAASGRSVTSGGGTPPGAMNLSSLTDPSDYMAGHLDKKVNEDSARGSLPVQVNGAAALGFSPYGFNGFLFAVALRSFRLVFTGGWGGRALSCWLSSRLPTQGSRWLVSLLEHTRVVSILGAGCVCVGGG